MPPAKPPTVSADEVPFRCLICSKTHPLTTFLISPEEGLGWGKLGRRLGTRCLQCRSYTPCVQCYAFINSETPSVPPACQNCRELLKIYEKSRDEPVASQFVSFDGPQPGELIPQIHLCLTKILLIISEVIPKRKWSPSLGESQLWTQLLNKGDDQFTFPDISDTGEFVPPQSPPETNPANTPPALQGSIDSPTTDGLQDSSTSEEAEHSGGRTPQPLSPPTVSGTPVAGLLRGQSPATPVEGAVFSPPSSSTPMPGGLVWTTSSGHDKIVVQSSLPKTESAVPARAQTKSSIWASRFASFMKSLGVVHDVDMQADGASRTLPQSTSQKRVKAVVERPAKKRKGETVEGKGGPTGTISLVASQAVNQVKNISVEEPPHMDTIMAEKAAAFEAAASATPLDVAARNAQEPPPSLSNLIRYQYQPAPAPESQASEPHAPKAHPSAIPAAFAVQAVSNLGSPPSSLVLTAQSDGAATRRFSGTWQSRNASSASIAGPSKSSSGPSGEMDSTPTLSPAQDLVPRFPPPPSKHDSVVSARKNSSAGASGSKSQAVKKEEDVVGPSVTEKGKGKATDATERLEKKKVMARIYARLRKKQQEPSVP